MEKKKSILPYIAAGIMVVLIPVLILFLLGIPGQMKEQKGKTAAESALEKTEEQKPKKSSEQLEDEPISLEPIIEEKQEDIAVPIYKQAKFIFGEDSKKSALIKYNKNIWKLEETDFAAQKLIHLSKNCDVEFGFGIGSIRPEEPIVPWQTVYFYQPDEMFNGIKFSRWSYVDTSSGLNDIAALPKQEKNIYEFFDHYNYYPVLDESFESIGFNLKIKGTLQDFKRCQSDFEEILKTLRLTEK